MKIATRAIKLRIFEKKTILLFLGLTNFSILKKKYPKIIHVEKRKHIFFRLSMQKQMPSDERWYHSRLVGWLVGVLTSSSTTRLYRGRFPRQSVWQYYVLPHMRQSWGTMTSVSAGHILLTPTQPVYNSW